MKATFAETNYQPLLFIQDKRFSIHRLQQYHLAISVGATSFRICCIDPTTSRCLLLAAYKLEAETITKRIKAIEQLFQELPWLAAKDWHAITLCVENQQYTLVPEPLFQEENTADYLKLATAMGSNLAKHFVHLRLGIVVAFAIDPMLLAWFQIKYAQANFCIIHQASSIIEGVWSYSKAQKVKALPRLFALTEPAHIHLTAIQQNNLLYYNRFSYSDSDEFLQYILMVIHTLGLDSHASEVTLGGSITKDSLAYRKACNYIRKVGLSNRPPYLNLSRAFREKAITTNHFDLLHAYHCQKLH